MARKKLPAKTRTKLEHEDKPRPKAKTGKKRYGKRKQFDRGGKGDAWGSTGRISRLDSGSTWGRTKRYVSPLPVNPDGGDPEEQYRRCGICKVRGIDAYATHMARLPGRTHWHNLCSSCFREYGCELGPEKGQKLVVNPKWAEHFATPEERESLKAALRFKAEKERKAEARKKKARERRKQEGKKD